MIVRSRARLPPAVRQAVVAHAERERPREACGFLVGARGHVQFAVATRNVAAGNARFEVDPAEHIALRRALRRLLPPLEIVGLYHSHPSGPAVPSETDIAEAWYPEWLHVIVSLAGARPVVGAFRIRRLPTATAIAPAVVLGRPAAARRIGRARPRGPEQE